MRGNQILVKKIRCLIDDSEISLIAHALRAYVVGITANCQLMSHLALQMLKDRDIGYVEACVQTCNTCLCVL